MALVDRLDVIEFKLERLAARKSCGWSEEAMQVPLPCNHELLMRFREAKSIQAPEKLAMPILKAGELLRMAAQNPLAENPSVIGEGVLALEYDLHCIQFQGEAIRRALTSHDGSVTPCSIAEEDKASARKRFVMASNNISCVPLLNRLMNNEMAELLPANFESDEPETINDIWSTVSLLCEQARLPAVIVSAKNAARQIQKLCTVLTKERDEEREKAKRQQREINNLKKNLEKAAKDIALLMVKNENVENEMKKLREEQGTKVTESSVEGAECWGEYEQPNSEAQTEAAENQEWATSAWWAAQEWPQFSGGLKPW